MNLDNSKGALFSWVLPKFHDDGTHEPWGPRDYPWANFKTPKKPEVHSEASPA